MQIPDGYREGPLTVGSLFSGIGGLELGLEWTGGFQTVWQVEIDASANAVRRRHWPDVPAYPDVKEFTLATDPIRPDLICGGFPCQDLSVAGKRAGLAGTRSGLFGEFMRIVAERHPRWVLVENVPGLLSSNRGRDMGTVLGTLAELGYGTAYRILDAQWLGVAQRRRRVFIVGCFGDWRRAAQVLFESEILPWDSPPSREAGAKVAGSLSASAGSGGLGGCGQSRSAITGRVTEIVNALDRHMGSGGPDDNAAQAGHLVAYGDNNTRGPIDVSTALNASKTGSDRQDFESETFVAHTLRSEGHDASEDGTGRGTPIVPVAFDTTQVTSPSNYSNPKPGDPCHPLAAAMHAPAVAYQCHGSNVGPMGTIRKGNGNAGGGVPFTAHATAVRRLTPTECERLQGFPDGWTALAEDGKPMSDSARYRMLGNAVCVPVARWIGQRILAMEARNETT